MQAGRTMNTHLPLRGFLLFAVLSAAALPLQIACQDSQNLGAPSQTEDAGSTEASAQGPQKYRAFVTATTYSGDLVGAAGIGQSGIASADALCQSSADGAGLKGTFVAYRSSASDSAADHIQDVGQLYDTKGQNILFENKTGIPGGFKKEVLDENGNYLLGVDRPSSGIWTGSSPAGKASGIDCQGWQSNDLFDYGAFVYGKSSSVGPFATVTDLACNNNRHLLCIEQKGAVDPRPTKRVFVTSKYWNGSLGGTPSGSPIARADARCGEAASSAGLTGTFRAWITGTENGKVVQPADRFSADVRYVRLDGATVFESLAMRDGGPAVLISVDEYGQDHPPTTAPSGMPVWTATLPTGRAAPTELGTCKNWTSTAATDYGASGRGDRGGEEWTYSTQTKCFDVGHLYCFEE